MTEAAWTGGALVTPAWLAARLDAPDLAVVDASLTPATHPTRQDGAGIGLASREFLDEHIPGAVHLDINVVSEAADDDLPHMMPSPQAFAAHLSSLGVDSRDRIVVYDSAGLFSAPRAWWMLRAFGAERVAILDGGLPRWKAEGRPLARGGARPRDAAFSAKPVGHAVVGLRDVQAAIASKSSQVLDARSAARFRGDSPEPRPGLRSGHIPGSLNLPFEDLVDEGRLLESERLRGVIQEAGIDFDRPIIAMCGSGVTAAILVFAFAILGKEDVAIYDASWSEWGARRDLPFAVGAPLGSDLCN